jgi:hypothetical protein
VSEASASRCEFYFIFCFRPTTPRHMLPVAASAARSRSKRSNQLYTKTEPPSSRQREFYSEFSNNKYQIELYKPHTHIHIHIPHTNIIFIILSPATHLKNKNKTPLHFRLTGIKIVELSDFKHISLRFLHLKFYSSSARPPPPRPQIVCYGHSIVDRRLPSSPVCTAKLTSASPSPTPQLRGKATVHVPLKWIPYFMREESAAEQSMGGPHGGPTLIPAAVVLLAGAAALLGLSYRVQQRRAARARLGLV